jgi:hypothetical protein
MSNFIEQSRFSRQSNHFGTDSHPTFWQRVHLDPWLLMLLFVTALFGLAILYSASAQDMGMVIRQTVSFTIAFVVMIVMAQVPPSMYRDFTPFFYVGGVLLLVLVKVIGEVRLGAQRWIDIPGFGSVQPSEFMKLGMPMLCAWFLSKRDLPPSLSTVLITLGAKGVWLSEQGKGELIPGFRVQALDTTAAGDTFNGAFVTAELEGLSRRDAIRFAHAAAAISVTRSGAQPSIPLRSEVDAFLAARS